MSKTSLTACLMEFCQANRIKISNRAVTQLADESFRHMRDSLIAEGRFAYPGFGVLKVRQRAGRTVKSGLSHLGGATFKVEPYNTIVFKPSPPLRAAAQEATLFSKANVPRDDDFSE